MRRQKPKYLSLGSVSSGTMRDEDLIPAFIGVLEDLRLSRADRKRLNELRREWDMYEPDNPAENGEWADLGDITQDLSDLAGNYCPDYCYFGAHPGDGADYGCWVSEELLQDTRQGGYDGYVYRSSEPPHSYIESRHTPAFGVSGDQCDICGKDCRDSKDEIYRYWLHVNERGNATLYRRVSRRWIEVWSIV